MKNIIVILNLLVITLVSAQDYNFQTKFDKTIKVLNFGTFHMGQTSDENSTEFDEHSEENKKEVHKIAQMLAKFKPTVILIETPARYDSIFQAKYQQYLKTPDMKFKRPDEVELLGYEIGRLSNTKRIYGIDYRESYNYNIYDYLEGKPTDSITIKAYHDLFDKNFEANKIDDNDVYSMLHALNQPEALDALITINADIVTHASTKGNHEGADEAAKYYHRNLVMYSNINQIDLSPDDRVFILQGASHTAFFREFMKRSPKYELVNVFDYLKK